MTQTKITAISPTHGNQKSQDTAASRNTPPNGVGTQWPKPPKSWVIEGPVRDRSFMGADLQGVDLMGRDLRGADLRGADLFGAHLKGADLRGTFLDMTRIVEISVPKDLPLEIVNQIRAFDFLRAQTRIVAPNRRSEHLPCPYAKATLRPVLFVWGSSTWKDGAHWSPPSDLWTLEEIIAAVLSALKCRHDLVSPLGLPGKSHPL